MSNRALPDVTSDTQAEILSTLQWVGMEGIAVPLRIPASNAESQSITAKANVYVSLEKPGVKGIHMSRLHKAVNELGEQPFNQQTIESILDTFIASQSGLGHGAKIDLSFDLLFSKPALLSGESGFQSYPITLKAEKGPQGLACEFELTIPYSSTCPCSASLARQLYADAVAEQFTESTINKDELLNWIQSAAGSVATPHSQRSYAYLQLTIGNNAWPDLAELIVQLEGVIGTPVQTAVKRVDEQEFAKLNANNLMFCEDAARRIKQALVQMPWVEKFWYKVEHQESLHAHNAVVIDQSEPIKHT